MSACLPASSTASPELCRDCPSRAHSYLLLFSICVFAHRQTGVMKQKSHPAHQREGTAVTLHQIWKTKKWQLIIIFNKQNSCFSLEKPFFFPPHFSSQHNDPVLWVCICLPGHSHLIYFVCNLFFLMLSTEKADNTTQSSCVSRTPRKTQAQFSGMHTCTE